MTYVLAASKLWDPDLATRLQQITGQRFHLITRREDLTPEHLAALCPQKVFFPHWSYILKPEIYEGYECVMFHMTDLPFGRGGSPLQNLIVRGFKETRISAFRCDGGIDTGPIYLKAPLSLEGTAQQIFRRATYVIEDMIIRIVKDSPAPLPQDPLTEETAFRRRTRQDGLLSPLGTLEQIYDHIRMLDAEGYPPAFLETESFIFEFTEAALHADNVEAKVRIRRK